MVDCKLTAEFITVVLCFIVARRSGPTSIVCWYFRHVESRFRLVTSCV